MGGIGNLRGAVLGGLIIGCIQQIADNRIGAQWTPAVVFAYLVLIMVFRPQGLHRRGDEGGGMSALARAPRRAAGREHRLLAVVVLAGRRAVPVLPRPARRFIDDAMLALAYVVMALGLNIVVGFAGLLDLGYVAFYAFGAYTVGWLASDFFSGVNGEQGHPHRRQRVRRPACPASTSTSC